MKYAIYQAPAYGDTAFGYNADADYKKVWDGDLEAWPEHDGKGSQLYAERLFHIFQRVDENHMPPVGYYGRSLSVGDVVCVDETWFSCEAVGWEQLNGPPPSIADAYGREAEEAALHNLSIEKLS